MSETPKETPQQPKRPPTHFDIREDLSQEEISQAMKIAEEKFEKEHDHEVSLEKSTVTVPGQEWVLVSFAGEHLNQKTRDGTLAMKIWGSFNTIQDAKEHLSQIGKLEENKNFDIYILEMYAWAVVPPKMEFIKDQIFHDEKLDSIISEHVKQKYKLSEVFDMRKEKLKGNPDMNQHARNQKIFEELKRIEPVDFSKKN